MDSHEGDFAFLTHALSRGIAQFRATVQAAVEAGSRRGDQLCRYVAAALDVIESKASELSMAFQNASELPDRAAIAQQLRFLNIYLRSLHEAVPWLETLRAHPHQVGLSYFLDEAARSLLKIQADPILFGDSSYMYSTLGLKEPFESLFQELGGALPEGPPPIVVNYPIQEMGNILLHPILVHELGHDAAKSSGLIDKVYAGYKNLDDLNARFNEAVASFAKGREEAGEPISVQEAALMLRPVLNAWLEEVLCDQLALAFLGPSFLFAAAAFLLPVERGPSQTHPPAATRVRLLLELADELDWTELLDSRAGRIKDWLEGVAEETPNALPDHVEFFVSAIGELAPSLRKVVGEHLGDGVYRQDAYGLIADALEQMLDHNILPAQSEAGEPLDRRAILVAGWIYRLKLEGDNAESLPAALEDLVFQRFLTKALEMSVVLERWRRL